MELKEQKKCSLPQQKNIYIYIFWSPSRYNEIIKEISEYLKYSEKIFQNIKFEFETKENENLFKKNYFFLYSLGLGGLNGRLVSNFNASNRYDIDIFISKLNTSRENYEMKGK